MRTITVPPVGLRFLAAAVLLLFLGRAAGAAEEGWTRLGAEDNFAAWQQPTGDWYVAGDARVDPNNHKASDPEPRATDKKLNVPPEGFAALFNGKNFNGWRLSPMVQEAWSIEDGILKSHGAIKDWGADLRTEKLYRDFVLLVDYRIPTISDSGIYIRGLMPGIGIFDRDRWEQFNLRSRGGSMEPSVIRLQKHVPQWIAGKLYKECPIEFRNIFIKELEPADAEQPARPRGEAAKGGRPADSPNAGLLSRIDRNDLPQGYTPAKHQEYVDRRMAELSEAQRAKVGQLWKEKQQIQPDMPNRGASFVKILEYVAGNGK